MMKHPWFGRAALVVVLATLGRGCRPHSRDLPPAASVSALDLKRYAGTWFEIARLPHPFQRDCFASEATYTPRPDGTFDVANTCHKHAMDGRVAQARARGRRAPKGGPGQLQVRFFWPFWASYWVLELAPDYSWAVVGHPGRKYLWILSRARTLDADITRGIVGRMQALGFATDRLEATPQPED